MTYSTTHSDTENDIEDFFASVEPASMKDAVHLREIAAARQSLDEAKQRLHRAVAAAREAGDSWTAIGVMLGTSKQNAYRKFGRPQRK
ncbi:hypothetical protein [Microbacterium luticocti]|uniref:hypothetical protein n=1 Tax=Microbacterium luticocti TaxID=451764 RepID=UPI00040BD184|nr:hypothetical protein [Microbacterium luticocti]